MKENALKTERTIGLLAFIAGVLTTAFGVMLIAGLFTIYYGVVVLAIGIIHTVAGSRLYNKSATISLKGLPLALLALSPIVSMAAVWVLTRLAMGESIYTRTALNDYAGYAVFIVCVIQLGLSIFFLAKTKKS